VNEQPGNHFGSAAKALGRLTHYGPVDSMVGPRCPAGDRGSSSIPAHRGWRRARWGSATGIADSAPRLLGGAPTPCQARTEWSGVPSTQRSVSNSIGSVIGPLSAARDFHGAGAVRRALGIRRVMTAKASASSSLARCAPRQ
jgi:hypothetical protein